MSFSQCPKCGCLLSDNHVCDKDEMEIMEDMKRFAQERLLVPMTHCFGCGERIWTSANLHESEVFCPENGECKIKDFDGVNRFRTYFRKVYDVQKELMEKLEREHNGETGTV